MAQESWLIIVKGKQGKYGEIPSQQPLRLQSDYLPCVKDCFSGNRRKEQPFIVFEKFNARIFGRFFKEFYMKKLVTLLLCVALACAFLCGCDNVGKKIVLTPQDEFVGQTLSSFMENEKGQKRLDFVIENGMVVSIDGIKNTTNTYWMLYTDDAENSNEAWGTIEYNGKNYASASLGADALVIAKGCTYIWVFTKF